MGLRINKVIGYGLTDVTTEDMRIVDPRINPDSILLDKSRTRTAEPDYPQWLAERHPDDLEVQMERQLLESRDPDEAYKTVTWEGEYGLPHVLVVRPADSPNWHRYDHPIDYEEAAIRGEDPPYVHRTVGNIHPYEGIYMDARTGERIVGEQADRVRVWRRLVHAAPEKWPSEGQRTESLNRVARALGFADHAEAERGIAPLVPDEIRRLCAWGELFTAPEVCLQLRPLLYVYHA